MKIKAKTIVGFTIVCIILSLIISATVMMFSNGVNLKIMSVERNSTSRMKASYKYYNGSKTHKVSLKAGETLKINFKSKVNKGELVINILDDNGEIVKTLGSNIEGTESIKVEEDVEYIISVKAYATGGSYDINWSKY